jgi:diaminopimelate decarboxylase
VFEIPINFKNHTTVDVGILSKYSSATRSSLSAIHPSGMPLLANRFHQKDIKRISNAVPQDIQSTLLQILNNSEQSATPFRIIREDTARACFSKIKTTELNSGGRVRFAYSIKTNPDPFFMRLALAHGLLAEAISQPEVSLARRMGFLSHNIILNGPGKFWPEILEKEVGIVFCDSLSELESIIQRQTRAIFNIIGVRVRPTNFNSRFGVVIDDVDMLDRIADLLRSADPRTELGLHFHLGPVAIGTINWWSMLQSMIKLSRNVEERAKRSVVMLDVGGGWTNHSLEKGIDLGLIRNVLYECDSHDLRASIVFELGRSIVQSLCVLVARILDVRRSREGGICDVVVDCGINDLPDVWSSPHPAYIYCYTSRSWRRVNRGTSRILGRLCMESDLLYSAVEVPEDCSVGDLLAVFNVGAYDTSMSYRFGEGFEQELN